MTKEEINTIYIQGWEEGIRYLGIDLDNYELRSYFQACGNLKERNITIQNRVKLAKKEHGRKVEKPA